MQFEDQWPWAKVEKAEPWMDSIEMGMVGMDLYNWCKTNEWMRWGMCQWCIEKAKTELRLGALQDLQHHIPWTSTPVQRTQGNPRENLVRPGDQVLVLRMFTVLGSGSKPVSLGLPAGNFLPRMRKVEPTGEWQKIKCRFEPHPNCVLAPSSDALCS